MMMMECNREEAVKAVALAESKYESGDVKGAHRMAVRAQAMYPSLQGIKQLVAALDVHVAASTSDWYTLLQVSPCADAALIKKQYRKLALLLHPDKNNALPAPEAFKLLSHAFHILCDSSLRAAHDLKQQQPPPNPTAATASNPNRFSSSSSEIPKQQQQQQNTYGRKQKDSTVEIPKQGTDGKMKDSKSAEIPKKDGNPDPAAVNDSKNGSKSDGQAAAGGATRAKRAFPPASPGYFWTYCPVCSTAQQQHKSMMNLFGRCIHCLKMFLALDLGAMNAASNAPKNQQPKQQRRRVVPRSNANADAAATKAESRNNININSTAPPQQQQQHHPKAAQEKSASAATNAAASVQNQNQHSWEWIPRQNASAAPKCQSCNTNGYSNCSSNIGPPQKEQQPAKKMPDSQNNGIAAASRKRKQPESETGKCDAFPPAAAAASRKRKQPESETGKCDAFPPAAAAAGNAYANVNANPFVVPTPARVPPYPQFGIPQFRVPAFPVAPAYVKHKSNRPSDNPQFACGFNSFAYLPPKKETAVVPTSESMPRDRPKVPSQENPSCSDNGAGVHHNSSSSSFQPLKRHMENPVYKPTVDKKNEVSSFTSETRQNVVSEKISMDKENLEPPVKSVTSDPSKKQDKAASKEESIDKKNQDPPAMSASADAPRSNGQDEAGAATEGEKEQQQRQEANKKPRRKRGVDEFKFDRSVFDRLFGSDNAMKKAKYSTK